MSDVLAGLTVRCGAASDTGRRQSNEDAQIARPPVFVVADGMGGHQHGAQASSTAVAALSCLLDNCAHTPEQVVSAVDAARAAVADLPTNPGGARAPGTTLAGVVLVEHNSEPYWLVVNIGDSRTYRFHQGALAQISVDHSEAQELIDAGHRSVPANLGNIVTRALGAGVNSQPDYWLIPVADVDRMMVCSDGLSREVGFAEITAILATEHDPAAAATHLVAAALTAGGHDNVTVVVVDVARAATPAANTVPHRIDVDESTQPKASRPADKEQP